MRHIPNFISVLRIALVWPILASIIMADYGVTLWLFLAAAISDGLDRVPGSATTGPRNSERFLIRSLTSCCCWAYSSSAPGTD